MAWLEGGPTATKLRGDEVPWPSPCRQDPGLQAATGLLRSQGPPTIEMAILALTCRLARNVTPQMGVASHAASRRREGSTALAYRTPTKDVTKFRTIWGHRVAAALWHRPRRAQASSLKPGTRQGMFEKLRPTLGEV